MNSRNLFYVRNLHLRFNLSNDKFFEALFFLEKFLFENYFFHDEILISNLKQKWIYECIVKGDYSNSITENLKIFENISQKSEILNLIEVFSEVPSFNNKEKFLNSFKKFNKRFNEVLNFSEKYNFKTCFAFQLIYLLYLKNINLDKRIKEEINFKDQSYDLFERVFIDIFFRKYNYKISKIYYLANLIYTSIKNR